VEKVDRIIFHCALHVALFQSGCLFICTLKVRPWLIKAEPIPHEGAQMGKGGKQQVPCLYCCNPDVTLAVSFLCSDNHTATAVTGFATLLDCLLL
jgi:hypothetical protein